MFALRFFGRLETPTLPVVGQSDAFIEGVFELGQRVEEAGGLKSVDPKTTWAALAVDTKQKLCLVRLTEYSAIDKQAYASIKPILPNLMSTPDPEMLQANHPFDPKNMRKRLGYEPTGSPSDEDQAPAPVTSGE